MKKIMKATLAKGIAAASLFAVLPVSLLAQSELYPGHFDLEEVRLLDSPFLEAMKLNDSALFEYDADRLLTAAVVQAGLNDDPDSKYYRWKESHPVYPIWYYESSVPHYVSSLALAYAASSDETMKVRLKERLEYMLGILKDCQDVTDDNTEGLCGYVGTEPLADMWKELYKGNTAPFIQNGGWCPFYYVHKMLAGLRDAWMYADNEAARGMYRKLADWSVNVISNLSDGQLQSILGVEHGGMVELLADAYSIFGDEKYLDAARRYGHDWLLDGMQSLNATLLDGQHANSTVPKFMGFERIYQVQQRSGSEVEPEYHVAACNFWEDVVGNRTVCIGGNSVSEHFIPAAKGSQYIDNLEGPESCNSYNMLKLSEILSDETHDARYADFYESTMFNHILSTQHPQTGGFVYFTSLRPQSYRIYSTANVSLWCCVGTGWENHSRYAHFIYTRSADNSTLYVNLFTPSELNADDFRLTQENSYPERPSTKITLRKGGRFTLAIRHPWWTTDGYTVKVNGETVAIDVKPGESAYARVERDWHEGDVVEVSIPMELRYEECPDYPDYIAFKYGPILLGARTSAASPEEAEATGLEYEDLPNQFADDSRWGHSPASMATPKSLSSAPLLIGEREEVLERITPMKEPLHFEINVESEWVRNGWKKLQLVPFHQIHGTRYQCYWYNRTADEFKNSEMAVADSLEMVMNNRTIDFVGTGEPQSELAHEAEYSSTSSTGIAGNERYRDVKANGYIQYTLFNHSGKTDSISLLCRFNVFDHDRRSAIYIDGEKLTDVVVPSATDKANSQGIFNMEYPVPAEMLKDGDGKPKERIVFRLQASENTMAPGLYYLRLLSGYGANDYRFVSTDWIAIDPDRVTQDKFRYDTTNNTLTVDAGTGQNDVCMQLDYGHAGYTVDGRRKYLLVVGNNLSLEDGASYLWWLNGTNHGTQVKPDYAKEGEGGESIIAWDITKSGLDANCTGSRWAADMGCTCFGLTSTTGSSTIRYIGFVESLDDVPPAVGVESTLAGASGTAVDVYDLFGRLVRKDVKMGHCVDGLPRGIYIVGKKKILVDR